MHPATIHVAAPVLAAAALNAWIYANGWDRPVSPRSAMLPPGPIIAMTWMAIFASLGYAHYLLRTAHATQAANAILLVLSWCLMYPVVTRRFRSTRVANLLTLVIAAILCVGVAHVQGNSNALHFVLPVLLWASYVNLSDAVECSSKEVNM